MPKHVQSVYERLSALGWHISFAESCTGGLVAGALVGVDGASSVFDGSFVTYANEAKVRLLCVKESDIARWGVVSEPVAASMAEGVAMAFSAEVGVGISGIAGPLGGTEEKPVGTVCFGYSINGVTSTQTCHFSPRLGRQGIRRAAVQQVYKQLLAFLPIPRKEGNK